VRNVGYFYNAYHLLQENTSHMLKNRFILLIPVNFAAAVQNAKCPLTYRLTGL
jgi:hypothetical protein